MFVGSPFTVNYGEFTPIALNDEAVITFFPWYDAIGEYARARYPDGGDCGDLVYRCRDATTGDECGDWVKLQLGQGEHGHARRLAE